MIYRAVADYTRLVGRSFSLDENVDLCFRPSAGQAQSHQTPPALPHTSNLPHANALNATSQSTGITPDHTLNPFHHADASAIGASSHSHFSSGATHQSSGGMGLPSIMNATPMSTQPTGPASSGYLPPIPQQPSQTSTLSLAHPASSAPAPPSSTAPPTRASDASHPAPSPQSQQMQSSRPPPPPQAMSTALPPVTAPVITPNRVAPPPPPPASTTPGAMSTSQVATSYRPLNV